MTLGNEVWYSNIVVIYIIEGLAKTSSFWSQLIIDTANSLFPSENKTGALILGVKIRYNSDIVQYLLKIYPSNDSSLSKGVAGCCIYGARLSRRRQTLTDGLEKEQQIPTHVWIMKIYIFTYYIWRQARRFQQQGKEHCPIAHGFLWKCLRLS